MMKHSIYLHIPFCVHRCAYCDFNTYAGQESAIPAYVDALCREIETVAASAQERISVHTVFFGGGTPSLMTPGQFKQILDSLRSNFDVEAGAEITTEANPGTVSRSMLDAIRAAGINRISFGAQSANGEELRMLERAHTFLDVMEAVSAARRAGFVNLNLDLIYGLPGQELETWQTTVRRVLDLLPEHISAYALTLEHGTPFGRWSMRGLLPMPDPDAAAEMYEWAGEALEGAGYQQYEISNWARSSTVERRTSNTDTQPTFACKHNLQYWRCGPYLGLGAGAHGYANGYRYSNVLRIATYIERMNAARGESRESRVGNDKETTWPMSPAVVNQHKQTVQDEMSEFMITGLRLTVEGIVCRSFHERFGRELDEVYGKQIDELMRVGLLEWNDEKDGRALKLTRRGRLLGNQVFLKFV